MSSTATLRNVDNLILASESEHFVKKYIRLPPEVWLQIFPYLKSADLQSASLTCCTFRYLAQPLLFSVLDMSPFFLAYNTEWPVRRPRSYLDRFLKRLEYYKLPHLAHGVRHCWVSPYSRHGFPERSQWDDTHPPRLIDPLINALPSFPNLRTLSWHCIEITPEWWSTIQSLHLTNLWINSSSTPDGASTLGSIAHLDLDQWPWEGIVTNHVSIHEEHTQGVGLSTIHDVIQPQVIRSITVPRVDTAYRLILVLSKEFHRLEVLKIPFASISHPDFLNALGQCPYLEELHIFPPASDQRSFDVKIDAVPPGILPSLSTYEGPYTHVLEFCDRPLKRVSLWGFDERPILCNPDALVGILMGLAESEAVDTLTSIQLSVTNITLGLLDSFAPFHRLKQISVQSQDSSNKGLPVPAMIKSSIPVSTLYGMLTTASLPQTLQHIKFDTRLGGIGLDLEAQERAAAEFMGWFASRHAAVQRMEITYGIYWTGIYGATWGRLRSNDHPTTSSDLEGPMLRDHDSGGCSSQSSSRSYILSTVVSTVHPLPLGKLTFTEHKRTILFPQMGKIGVGLNEIRDAGGSTRRRVNGVETGWTHLWSRVRRIFWKGRTEAEI